MKATQKKQRKINGIIHYNCTKCGEWKPASKYFRDKNRANGLTYWCKECWRASCAC